MAESTTGSLTFALLAFWNCQPDILTKFNKVAIKKHQITKCDTKLVKAAEEKKRPTVIHNLK